jgi:hypothetical protein
MSLKLTVNRLSGYIPSSLYHLSSIDLLKGNVFDCHEDRQIVDRQGERDLPDHDSESDSYRCGSSAVNDPLYAWVGVMALLVCVLGALCVVVWRRESEQTAEKTQMDNEKDGERGRDSKQDKEREKEIETEKESFFSRLYRESETWRVLMLWWYTAIALSPHQHQDKESQRQSNRMSRSKVSLSLYCTPTFL